MSERVDLSGVFEQESFRASKFAEICRNSFDEGPCWRQAVETLLVATSAFSGGKLVEFFVNQAGELGAPNTLWAFSEPIVATIAPELPAYSERSNQLDTEFVVVIYQPEKDFSGFELLGYGGFGCERRVRFQAAGELKELIAFGENRSVLDRLLPRLIGSVIV